MALIYKILPRAAWATAQATGIFTGSPVDLRDGFIHFSTAAQVKDTARLHFRGQTDLVVLEVPTEILGPELKWEPSRGGQLFPHLYGPLATDLVTQVCDAPLDAEGIPTPKI